MSIKKILVVDDEPKMIEPVLDRLEFKYGKESFIFTQYFSDALAVLKSMEISCIYLDLIMPTDNSLKYKDSLINGINFLVQIRESQRNIPIVCYTVVKEEEPILIIKKYNAEYICKTDDDGFYKLFIFFAKHFERK